MPNAILPSLCIRLEATAWVIVRISPYTRSMGFWYGFFEDSCVFSFKTPLPPLLYPMRPGTATKSSD